MPLLHKQLCTFHLIWRLAREHLMVAGHGQGNGPGGLQEAAGGHQYMLWSLLSFTLVSNIANILLQNKMQKGM